MISHSPSPSFAPVNGGCRWRGWYDDRLEFFRKARLRTQKRDIVAPVSRAAAASSAAASAPPVDLSPHVVTVPSGIAVVGEEYVYRPRACDPVSDGFIWYLETSIPGMSVDRYSGLVSWRPASACTVEVVLGVSSVYGACGRQTWRLTASPAAVASPRSPSVTHTVVDLDGDLSTTHDQTSSGKTVYDEHGREVQRVLDRDGDLSTTGDQSATRYEYDHRGRVVKTTYADGTSTSVTYTARGQKATETDQLGNTTYYEYDLDGRLTAVVLPQVKHPSTGKMVHVRYEYGYDKHGNQISLKDNIFQTDPADASTIDRSDARETKFTYDWQGRQTSRTLPDGSQEFFFYNDKGQQVRHVSFEGRVTVLEYDSYDRLVKKLYYSSVAAWDNGAGISGHTVTYTYDAHGRVVKEVDSKRGTTDTIYDTEGRVTRKTSPEGVINYEYDEITGQVSRTWTGTDSSKPITDVRNTYDKFGRLETVTTYAREGALLENKEVAKYIYDVIGNLDKIHHSNGIVTDYRYDLLNRLKEVVHSHDNGTPDDYDDDVVVEKFEYTYHANGNKSGEKSTNKDGKQNIWNWDYDALGRLIKERHDNANDDLDQTTEYVFDLVGNRLEKRTDKGNNGTVEEVIKSQFDKNDRLLNETRIFSGESTQRTDYSYNKTEQIGKIVTDMLQSRVESKTKMEYNAQGRLAKLYIETYVDGKLTKTVTQEYEYDSSGIKVRQIESIDSNADGVIDSTKRTDYLNDEENHTGYSQVLEERETVAGELVKVTTYTIGHDVLAQANAAHGILALLYDGHGSTRAVADKLGKILQEYDYDAYGNALGFDAAVAMTKLLYSGEQFNPVSGLQYLRARWYNPQSGTFNRLDPFSGNKNTPQSFNKYSYAHNNPYSILIPPEIQSF